MLKVHSDVNSWNFKLCYRRACFIRNIYCIKERHIETWRGREHGMQQNRNACSQLETMVITYTPWYSPTATRNYSENDTQCAYSCYINYSDDNLHTLILHHSYYSDNVHTVIHTNTIETRNYRDNLHTVIHTPTIETIVITFTLLHSSTATIETIVKEDNYKRDEK